MSGEDAHVHAPKTKNEGFGLARFDGISDRKMRHCRRDRAEGGVASPRHSFGRLLTHLSIRCPVEAGELASFILVFGVWTCASSPDIRLYSL